MNGIFCLFAFATKFVLARQYFPKVDPNQLPQGCHFVYAFIRRAAIVG